MPYRIDFHCHSTLSPDGSLRDTDLQRVFNAGLLDVVAITDHDEIEEARRLQEMFGEGRVIIGEEINTSEGEIIGLYLSERIEPGMTAAETIEAIQEQDGLVYIPHPFETLRKGLTAESLSPLAVSVDMIEVVNGRSFSAKARRQAVEWAKTHGVSAAAGSDAHGRRGWGRVYTELPEKPTRDNLLSLMAGAKQVGNKNGVVSYMYPKVNRARKRMRLM